MQRELINETAKTCSGDEAVDLAKVQRNAKKLLIGARTRDLNALHEFKHLEYLALVPLDQQAFDTVMAAADPRFLVIWDLKAVDLSAISSHRRIERLVVIGAIHVADISPLSHLKNLRLLSLERMPKARDLAPLAALRRLEHLCFAGGHYASPKRVPSLKPLAQLAALRSVNLIGVTAKDGSLEPLANLPGLVEVELSNSWPVEEFARLSVVHPNAGCEWFAPYVKDTVMTATSDGFVDVTLIHISGKGQPAFSRPTRDDWRTIEGHVRAFEALQVKFQQQYGKK